MGKGLRNTLRVGLVLSGVALLAAEKLAPKEFQASTQIHAIIQASSERRKQLDEIDALTTENPELAGILKKLSMSATPAFMLEQLKAQKEIDALLASDPELMRTLERLHTNLPSFEDFQDQEADAILANNPEFMTRLEKLHKALPSALLDELRAQQEIKRLLANNPVAIKEWYQKAPPTLVLYTLKNKEEKPVHEHRI